MVAHFKCSVLKSSSCHLISVDRFPTYFFARLEHEDRVRGHEGALLLVPGSFTRRIRSDRRRIDPRVAERGRPPRRLRKRLVALWLLAGSLADDDVALEVDPVRVGELEHGEEVGLGHAPDRVVRERRQDRRVGAAAVKYYIEIVMHTINGVYKLHLFSSLGSTIYMNPITFNAIIQRIVSKRINFETAEDLGL